MIDIFSILLTHGLILLVGWRLLFRDDLDSDDPHGERAPRPWLDQTAKAAPEEGRRDA